MNSTPLRIAGALTGAAIAITLPAAAQAKDVPRPVAARLQAILDRAQAAPDAVFPGVALRVRLPGHRTWAGAAGTMRATDRFRAGSIVKPFVAAAVLQLSEEGRLALDDPITAVLPARVTARFPEAGDITVRMLLDHTSGIGEYADEAFDAEVVADPRRRWRVGELLNRAAAAPRPFAPGARFGYSNADYNLLGLVLRHVTGRPWRAVVRDRVIRPLHLAHTSLPAPGTMPAGRDIARGHEVVDGRLVDVTDVDSSMAGAAGGNALLTSTADLSRFLRALLAGRLFRHAATVDELRTFVAAADEHGLDGYGLGLERYGLPGGVEVLGHVGTAAGYRTLMFHLPAQHADLTMVMTAPGDPGPVLVPALELLIAEAS